MKVAKFFQKTEVGSALTTLMWMLVVTLTAPCVARAVDGKSVAQAMLGSRYALGGSRTQVENVQPSSISNFVNPNCFWTEANFLFPVGIRWGMREVWDQNAQVDFNGNGYQRAEIYLTQADLGLIGFLPLPYVQPWVSAGYLGGTLAITNPKTRGNDNWLAAFENETHWIWGTYAAAGVDLVLDRVGLRLSYQQDSVRTEGFAILNKQRPSFETYRWSIGMLAPVF